MSEAMDIMSALVATSRATPWRDDDWMELELPTKEELFGMWKAKS